MAGSRSILRMGLSHEPHRVLNGIAIVRTKASPGQDPMRAMVAVEHNR
jgi:hypothetical protein